MLGDPLDLEKELFVRASRGDRRSQILLAISMITYEDDEVTIAERLAAAEACVRLAAADDSHEGKRALLLCLLIILEAGVAQGSRSQVQSMSALALAEDLAVNSVPDALGLLIYHLNGLADEDEAAGVRLNEWGETLKGTDLSKLAEAGRQVVEAAKRGEGFLL